MAQTHSSKRLHPLFSKEPPVDPQLSSVSSAQGEDAAQQPLDDETESAGRTKRQKLDHNSLGDSNDGKPLDEQARAPSVQRSLYDSLKIPATIPKPDTTLQPTAATDDTQPVTTPPAQSDSNPVAADFDTKTAASNRPRRVLKVNMNTGTLGSPPKSKKPSRILCIKYGTDEEKNTRIGEAIRKIMNGEGTWHIPVTPPKPKKRGRPKKADLVAQRALAALESGSQGSSKSNGSSKPSHPFFGKSKNPAAEATPNSDTKKVRQTVSMSTPISPRKQRSPFVNFDTKKVARFGSNIGTAGTKVPGAKHPMWPAKGMSTILGDFATNTQPSQGHTVPNKALKDKGQIVSISQDESCLTEVQDGLSLNKVLSDLSYDDSLPLPVSPELRLPKRYFESGRKLRSRVIPELRTYRPSDGTSLTPVQGSTQSFNHPAIDRLYNYLGTNLSAYDRSTCENSTWTQKYAPTTAAEVLQAGKEGLLLKKWLEALRIQAIDTGAADPNGKPKGKSEKPIKKKRKNKLDGFIVDSDDDLDELGAVSDEEEDSENSDIPMSKKTMVRGGRGSATDTARFQNCVLISGPHGSGKTATVYAIAKELGFEIFEINSSSRRGGKDIMEKVGDMTRNHLVHHGGHDKKKTAEEDDNDETTKDLKSGKQGMMTSFFKPKVGAPPKTNATKPSIPAKDEAKAKSSTPRSQKQSLILIEEVDVLYEEDKQFWSTLMGLISQSRRPFVMTCSAENEALVPTQTLPLHGIFRLSPSPANLAVDLCLLIAANEGHALKRRAVETAYAARGEDLRATIMDLNYWCQTGVGDRRGGFDWFYLRWPKGCDVDENGDVVRVVSEDTYMEGMGWIGRDPIISAKGPLARDQEVCRQVWDFWSEPLRDRSRDLVDWARDVSSPSMPPPARLNTIAAYDEYCDTLSLSDLCAQGSFGLELQQGIDATLPHIPTKAKDDYILGQKLLEATTVVRFDTLASRDISYCLTSLGRQVLQAHTAGLASPAAISKGLAPFTETAAIQALEKIHAPKPLPLKRYDIALAFDPLAVGMKALTTYLDPSVFDRPMKPIVLDVAPWVRSIVSYDNRLMKERAKLSSLLSEGGDGKGTKRMRNTRAAYSALEGGQRQSTRRDRYFGDVPTGFVLRTAGDGWVEAGERELRELEARMPREEQPMEGVEVGEQAVQMPGTV